MNGDPLIQRITDRLAVDPELRLEVARELQAHLEDCAAEFRAGGAGEAEARTSAEKALGDPIELAEQLWQANRGRLRFRAVARWAAGAALLPAAVAVAWMLATGLRGVLTGSLAVEPLSTVSLAGLSEEQRFVFHGDPNATPMESAKSISDRWPRDPVYYGNYVAYDLGYLNHGGRPDPSMTEQMLALADRGERLDPNNAFYNFLKATWFIRLSSEEEDDDSWSWEKMDAQGAAGTIPGWKVTIRDPAMFQRGLEELRRGLAKPEFTSRTVDMTELRVSFLSPPRRLSDVLARAYLEESTLMPLLSPLRSVARAVSAYAIDRAARGDPSAVELARSVDIMADKLGNQSDCLIELLVATSVRQIGLVGMEQVGKRLKQDELSASAFQERRRLGQAMQDVHGQPGPRHGDMEHAGMLWGTLVPNISGYQVDFEPLRTTEDFVFFELALVLLLAILIVLAAIFGLATIWGMAFRKGAGKPILLFVGWRRIGRIVLVSIVLPLGLYGLYAWWQVSRPGAYGLNYSLGRLMVEAAMMLAVIPILLVSMAYRAIRQRCLELGLEAPAPVTLRRRAVIVTIGGLMAAACLVYIVGWWAGAFRPDGTGSPDLWAGSFVAASGLQGGVDPYISSYLGLISLVFLLAAVWGIREWSALLGKRAAAFRRAFYRSAIPILCSAVIVVGLAVGGLLSLGESLAARRVTGTAAMSLRNEIERSAYRALHDQFRSWHRQDMAELARETPAAGTGATASSQP